MRDKDEPLSEESIFQKILKWIILAGIFLYFALYFGYVIYVIVFVQDNWIVKTMQEHFGVTISLPFAAIVALFIVLLLRYSTGPIEFEGLGFKFSGASGPIVLWVLCFLAIVTGIKMLWNP